MQMTMPTTNSPMSNMTTTRPSRITLLLSTSTPCSISIRSFIANSPWRQKMPVTSRVWTNSSWPNKTRPKAIIRNNHSLTLTHWALPCITNRPKPRILLNNNNILSNNKLIKSPQTRSSNSNSNCLSSPSPALLST